MLLEPLRLQAILALSEGPGGEVWMMAYQLGTAMRSTLMLHFSKRKLHVFFLTKSERQKQLMAGWQ